MSTRCSHAVVSPPGRDRVHNFTTGSVVSSTVRQLRCRKHGAVQRNQGEGCPGRSRTGPLIRSANHRVPRRFLTHIDG